MFVVFGNQQRRLCVTLKLKSDGIYRNPFKGPRILNGKYIVLYAADVKILDRGNASEITYLLWY